MPDDRCILTLNGGSSSIKFAAFVGAADLKPLFTGQIERIGQPNTTLNAKRADGSSFPPAPLDASTHAHAADALIDWVERNLNGASIAAVGHRIVHGGVNLHEPARVTDELLVELHRAEPLDRAHLPREIALVESLRRRLPDVPQVACFDTDFHHDLPRVAQLLPIPLAYHRAGVRRFGFHGLSYTYLISELRRQSPDSADGKIILAHLGSGASMAAVHHGKPIDTTMAFTPTAGLVMATRPGDLDPGLLVYLMRTENLTPDQLDAFINQRCGLSGLSETSADLRDLQSARAADSRAADALEVFYHSARKWIGSLAATLAGLDTLVFSGGIGEHSPEARSAICSPLSFLGIQLDDRANALNAPVISAPQSRVTVRVIPTNEELVIAQSVSKLLRWT